MTEKWKLWCPPKGKEKCPHWNGHRCVLKTCIHAPSEAALVALLRKARVRIQNAAPFPCSLNPCLSERCRAGKAACSRRDLLAEIDAVIGEEKDVCPRLKEGESERR